MRSARGDRRCDWLGGSVAVEGSTALVGAPTDDIPYEDQGSAPVFRWNGSAWLEEATLVSSDGGELDNFGTSVAIAGEVALVGATCGCGLHNAGQDAAYVFRRNGSSWVEEAKLTPSDAPRVLYFGTAVALSADWAVVGAWGAAYAFHFDGSGWTEFARLTTSDGSPRDFFGFSIALSGNVLVVGVRRVSDTQGAAYIFRWNGSSWLEAAKLVASDAAAVDIFGWSVALADEVALVAPSSDVAANREQGAAYVFRLTPTSVLPAPAHPGGGPRPLGRAPLR